MKGLGLKLKLETRPSLLRSLFIQGTTLALEKLINNNARQYIVGSRGASQLGGIEPWGFVSRGFQGSIICVVVWYGSITYSNASK